MPTVFNDSALKFFFYSNEGDPREPIHVHVRRGACEAKIWLEPNINIASSYGFNAKELRAILGLAEQRVGQLVEAWHEHFS